MKPYKNYNKIHSFFREFLRRIRFFFRYIKGKRYPENSYYPDSPRKPKWRIRMENILYILRYGDMNEFYFMYGLDRKGCHNSRDFINYREFARSRDKYNLLSFPNYACVLRDKVLFSAFLRMFGIMGPESVALIRNGKVFVFQTRETVSVDTFLDMNQDVFVKLLTGECGKGVFPLRNSGFSREELHTMFVRSVFLVEKRVKQHHVISEMYPDAVNTIRLVTYKNPSTGKIDVLPSVMRIGVNGAKVDNWSQGGIAVGINLGKGTLKKEGLYRPEIAKVAYCHPNSGVVFDGFKIPFFNKAVSDAIFLHSNLELQSIGWDIAISEDGPVFIEGNDNWEVSLNQACNRDEALEFYKRFHC